MELEILNNLFELAHKYMEYAYLKSREEGALQVVVSILLFSTLPMLVFVMVGLIARIVNSRILILLAMVLYPIATLLFISTLHYFLFKYAEFLGYFFAIPLSIFIGIIIYEWLEDFVEELYYITRKEIFLNFLGYIDLEHYMLWKVAEEGKRQKMEKEVNDDDDNYDDYDELIRTSGGYSHFPQNIWYGIDDRHR